MKVRIKIGDFKNRVSVTCADGKAVVEGNEYTLPEKFFAKSNPDPSIKYALRLFHLHTEREAEEILKTLPDEISEHLKIIKVGRNFDGVGLDRFWIVKEEFDNQDECEEWRDSILKKSDFEYRKRISIEGGIYKLYPDIPATSVVIADQNDNHLLSGKNVEIVSPSGMEITDAPVGESFHWEHTENLRFLGKLYFMPGENGVLVVNEIPLEEYLASVNSSEMSAEAPIEFLKAQTIAARSTVIATMDCHHHGEPYDLCNGDHCQCYYGSGRTEERSLQAAEMTDGIILIHDSKVCDTRYAKICGGITEKFHHVWENYNPGCLPSKFDGEGDKPEYKNWNEYINDKPDCYCNPEKYPYPDYFDYARPWFRWEIDCEVGKLSQIIEERTGENIGRIQDIKIRTSGESGRITGLEITGSKDSVEVNGELNIRRVLSESHLPSSCFYTTFEDDKIVFHGAGWGHGVGMCQMGALNMAVMGFDYRRILAHYYPHTQYYNINHKINTL